MVSCNIWRSGTGVSLFRFTRSQSFVLTLAYISLTIPLQTLKATKPPSPDAEKDLPSNGPKLTRTTSRQSVQRKTARYIRTTKRIFLDPLKIVLYLRFPAVLITVYYGSITFGTYISGLLLFIWGETGATHFSLGAELSISFQDCPVNWGNFQLFVSFLGFLSQKKPC